jgi:hypothetical protein
MARLTILSYGGGQDSTAILYRLVNDPVFRKKYAPEKLMIIMADTGNEHKTTDYYREYIQDYCKEKGVPFYFVDKFSNYFSESWRGGLVAFNERKTAIQSKAFPKTCTDQLKIRPIYKFLDELLFRKSKEVQQKVITSINNPEKATFLLQQSKLAERKGEDYVFPVLQKKAIVKYAELYGKIDVILGIAKGEEKRMSKDTSNAPKWFQQSINKVYPLVEEGMDRKACQDYIESVGELVPYPSNCIICPFMSKQELLFMYRFNKEWYHRFCRMEQRKIDKSAAEGIDPKKNLGVWGTTKLLPEILEEAIEKHGHMTDKELDDYKMSHGHCVMSSF